MSVTKRIAFGAAASWFSRGITIFLGLVLMPVLFRHLPKEELGVWLLLGQSWAAMGILDLGFGVTFTRRIALAKGKSGGDLNSSLTDTTLHEIADLSFAGRRIYRFMALGVFLVSWTIGFFYLRNLKLDSLSHGEVWCAWTILCACQSLNVWATVWTCLLQGVGYIGWDALISSFTSAAMLIAQIFAVLLGGGLIELAAIAAISALAQRFLIRRFARRRHPELFSLQGKWNPLVMEGIVGTALRAWFTALGTILIQNTDNFFIASAKGARDIPAFRAAFLVVLNLHMIAGVFASSSVVFISHLWQAGKISEVQRIVQRNLRIGLCIMLCGGAAILASGASLFNLWLGPSNYVGFAIVMIFVVTFILEQQTFIISTGCRATEHEVFAGWMMVGGVLKLLLAFVFLRRFGLLGLAASTLIAQILTAHWFVPYCGLKRLQFGLKRYLSSVLIPCVIVFAAASIFSVFAVTLANEAHEWVKLASACATSGTVLVIAMLLLVLDARQRQRVGAWISSKKAIVAAPVPK